MRTFDLRLIWCARPPFKIPGFLSLHLQIEAKRVTAPIDDIVDEWFNKIPQEEKEMVRVIHLN